MNRKHIAILATTAIATAAGLLIAGPLTPPAGPVSSSYKTLAEVEPRTAINATNTPGNSLAVYIINQPGSYYLTGNIPSVPSGKFGIMVLADPVTIDLNGFSIIGGSGASCGISTDSTYYYSLTVKNGTVAGFTNAGVDMSAIWAGHVQNITADSNGVGIKCFEGLVEDCTGMANGQGYVATGTTTFLHCLSVESTGNAFSSSGYAIFDSCTSDSAGAQGFTIGTNSTIRNCVAINSGTQGIVCGQSSTVENNKVLYSPSGISGIWAQGASTIEGNELIGNGYGVYASSTGNLIIRNRCTGNTTSFYIPAGNRVGLIITPTTNSTLINGSSGGGLGTTDPNANIIY